MSRISALLCGVLGCAAVVPADQIFVIGGTNASNVATSAVEVLNTTQQDSLVWAAYSRMKTARTSVAAVEVGGQIYAIGGQGVAGWVDSPRLRTVEVIDTRYQFSKWTAYKTLRKSRLNHAAVVIGGTQAGRIYAIGGLYADGTVEVINTADASPAWEIMYSKMSTARSRHAAVAVGGKIYAIGGVVQDGVQIASLRTVEVVNTADNDPVWVAYSNMTTARGQHAAVAVGGKIYAIGGFIGGKGLSTVEVINTADASPAWAAYSSMTTARIDCAAVAIGSKIYAIGGFAGDEFIMTVEVINTADASPAWAVVSSMQSARYGFAAVAIEKGNQTQQLLE